MDRNAKIYIAGHTGLVGSAVVRKLKSLSYKKYYYKNPQGDGFNREG